jgi:hypothetical protein
VAGKLPVYPDKRTFSQSLGMSKCANTDHEFTFADYHPDEPGASQGGRALFADNFDGRALGPWFDKLRRARIAEFGGVPFASRVKSSRRAANIRG